MSVRKDSFVWLGVGLLVLAVLVSAVFFILTFQKTATVRLGDGVFRAKIASTNAQQVKGLSGTKSLSKEGAMLFVYDSEMEHKIWMKDMHFSIDAVWLNADKRVIHIETGLTPDSYPTEYGANKKSQYVLELSEGAVQRARIKLGMQMVLNDGESGK